MTKFLIRLRECAGWYVLLIFACKKSSFLVTRPKCVVIKGNDMKHDIPTPNKEKIFVLTNKMSLNESGHSHKRCKSRDLTVWQFRSKNPLVHK